MKIIRYFFARLIKKYKRLNIQILLALSFTFIAVCGTVLMGFALFWRFSVDRTDNQIAYSENLLHQMSINVDNYLNRMIHISSTVASEVVQGTEIVGGDFNTGMELIFSANAEDLVSIAVFDKNGVLVGGAPNTILKQDLNISGTQWFETALSEPYSHHFFTPYVQNLWQSTNGVYNWVVSHSSGVQLTRRGKPEAGILLVDMNFSGIKSIFPEVTNLNDGYIYLMSGDGELIYHPKQQLIYTGLFEENNVVAARYDDGTRTEIFDGEVRQISVETVSTTGWKLISVTPSYSVFANFSGLFVFVILLILFFVMVILYFNIRLSRYIADPIKRLDSAVKLLETGSENVTFPKDGCVEVQHLSSSVNSMVKNMRKLFSVILEQESEKRLTELEVLNSQINPHFLYNSLDSVVWMTESGRYEEAKQMVLSLARLFRIALSKGSNIISINNELEHAQNYMIIQKIRYKNKFTFDIACDESVKDLFFLKLTLQPLLENAIYHGMASAVDDGQINVNVYSDGRYLIADVTDNGIGIPPDKVSKLLDEKYADKGFSKGSGIGLFNVDKRIRLTFGKKYGLEIISEPDEGTTVRVRTPVITQESAQKWGEKQIETQ